MNNPHPASDDVAYQSVGDLRRALDEGSLTSTEIVHQLLERVHVLDDPSGPWALSSIAAISADALDVAGERDAERASGHERGVLHGIPVLIKDNIEALGLPALAGSTALVGRPTRDAPLVTRLREAGAIVFGSTNLSQWANIRSPRSTSGYSASGGLVANPWALDRSAGGSSSGSGAALAAGLAPLAVGTETDGSIVCPASLNGVVGLKPTVGVVPARYVVPISASQDSPGPMGRSVEDVATMYGVLAGESEVRFHEPLRCAVATNWRTWHPQTDRLFEEAVAEITSSDLSVVPRDMALPGGQEYGDEHVVLLSELFDDLGAYLADRPGEGVRSLAGVVAYEDEHREIEQRYFEHENFVTALSMGGRAGAQYVEARARNLAWATSTCLTPGLEDVDVILAPGYGPSWKSDLAVGGHPAVSSVATMAPAIAGWPILNLPMGMLDGLPVGLCVLGRPRSEWLVLEVARRIERALRSNTGWTTPAFAPPRRG